MNGPRQLTSVLERGAVDVVIVALGTNDLYFARDPESALIGRSPVDAWRALEGLIAVARSTGVLVLVATIPPRYDDPRLAPDIAELNRLITEHVPAGDVIDFTTHFRRHLFLPDGLHLNAHGQGKRARRAATVLLRIFRACNPTARRPA